MAEMRVKHVVRVEIICRKKLTPGEARAVLWAWLRALPASAHFSLVDAPDRRYGAHNGIVAVD